MAFIGRSPTYGAYSVQSLTPDSATTVFNLDFQVGSAASLMVYYGGIYQIPTVAYQIGSGGSTIVFSEAPVIGTTLTIVYLGHQLTVARTAAEPWFTITSNTTASPSINYFCDTTSNPITLTLPASAELGTFIGFNDLAGTFGTNNLTIDRNGHKINGSASDLIVSVNNASNTLVYSGATYGWKLKEV